jgi:hypothetical protein
MVAEGIQQHALLGGPQQQMMFVLAMEVHQQIAYGTQLLGGGGVGVDPGAQPAVRPQDAAQDAGLPFGQLLFLEMAQDPGLAGDIEDGADFGFLLTMANQARIGAIADGKPQGGHQERFAGSGLAADHAQSLAIFDLHPVDQGDVTDEELV